MKNTELSTEQKIEVTTRELCDLVKEYTDKLIKSALSKDLKLIAANHTENSTLPNLSSLNFKSMRKAKGLTLRKVEEITGISNAYLSQLETGKVANPSYNTVKTLYDIYVK